MSFTGQPFHFATMPEDPDPRVPLQNLDTVRTRMDSLQLFLIQSINNNTLISQHQMDLVSAGISSAIHEIISNGAALLACSHNPRPGPDPGTRGCQERRGDKQRGERRGFGDRGGRRGGAAGGARPLLRDLRQGFQARRQSENAHESSRQPVQDSGSVSQAGKGCNRRWRGCYSHAVLVPVRRLQP
ncbi:hypothetical protein ACLB2K_006302 [Fragaria x ananassa]